MSTDNLKKLREPFPPNQISKLPKPTAAQTKEVKDNFKAGIRCDLCGGWHHPKVVHLDYVGHAALTDRLLDIDMAWSWEPVALDSDGLPALDKEGGLWIRLTVCGVARLGYGAAEGKSGGDAMKEKIGDALRNAAMRFGAALDLWHKGDLHLDDDPPKETPKTSDKPLNGSHSPSDGAMAALTEERQQHIRDVSTNVIFHFKAGDIAKAYEEYRNNIVDPDEQVAFTEFNRNESKMRNGLKAHHEELRKKAKEGTAT